MVGWLTSAKRQAVRAARISNEIFCCRLTLSIQAKTNSAPGLVTNDPANLTYLGMSATTTPRERVRILLISLTGDCLKYFISLRCYSSAFLQLEITHSAVDWQNNLLKWIFTISSTESRYWGSIWVSILTALVQHAPPKITAETISPVCSSYDSYLHLLSTSGMRLMSLGCSPMIK